MMEQKPLVSVVIPTYNRAEFLVKAIESVLRQSYACYEIIVADDGSSDDTMKRVGAIEGPINYIRLKHSGHPGEARNQAVKAARGSLIAFLDADDLWREDKLSKQVRVMVENETVGLVYSNALVFSGNEPSQGEPALEPHQLQLDSVFEALLKGCFIHPSMVVVRKRLFDRIGLFDLQFKAQEDYYFWLRAAQVAPARAVPEPLVFIRRHPESLSHQRGISDWQGAILILEHLLASKSLTFHQRLILRKTLSRFNSHVGIEYLETGQVALGRSYLRRSLLWNPIQGRAWTALLRSYGANQR